MFRSGRRPESSSGTSASPRRRSRRPTSSDQLALPQDDAQRRRPALSAKMGRSAPMMSSRRRVGCASTAMTMPQAATDSTAGRQPIASANAGSTAPANAAPPGTPVCLIENVSARRPGTSSACQHFGRRRRDGAVAQADDERRDGKHRRRARGQQRDHHDPGGAEQHARLRHADRSAARDEMSGSEARDHRADVEQSDENADQFRGNAEVARHLRCEHRDRRSAQRGKDLDRQCRGQRDGRCACRRRRRARGLQDSAASLSDARGLAFIFTAADPEL